MLSYLLHCDQPAMPAWTIISPREKDYGHPMRFKIFRIMKTIYRMLDPQNEPSSVNEGKHIATFGYAISQKSGPGPSGLRLPVPSSEVIHFRLSTQSVTRFALLFVSMQIEDTVRDALVPVPGEITADMMD